MTSEPMRFTTLRDSELPAIASSPRPRDPRRTALKVTLALTFLAAAWVASALWVGMLLGAVMGFTTQPLFRRLAHRWPSRPRGVAAAVVTLASGVLLLFLGTVMLVVLGRELVEIVGVLQRKLASGTSPTAVFGPHVTRLMWHAHLDPSALDQRINEALGQAASKAAAAAGAVLEATGGAALTLIVAIVTEYYVLLDWAQIAIRLECILPLEPRHTRALFLEFREVGRGAFVGSVATAFIQGLLATIGYAIAGVPQAVTWGFATAAASLLPVVGTMLVWTPIGIWMVAQGHVAGGVFTLAWSLLVVSLAVDYVIRPALVGKKGHAHPLLTLVALLGGVQVFGLAGLIVAPMVMSLFLAALRIYERDVCALGSGPEATAERAVASPPGRPCA
jgi:predicted PurR-regulated permease PerM